MTAAKTWTGLKSVREIDHLRALAELQSLGPSGDELVLHAVEGLGDRRDKQKGAKRSNLRRNLIPDMRKGSLGTRMAAFLPVNPATT